MRLRTEAGLVALGPKKTILTNSCFPHLAIAVFGPKAEAAMKLTISLSSQPLQCAPLFRRARIALKDVCPSDMDAVCRRLEAFNGDATKKPTEPIKRPILCVVDRSGSMDGEPIKEIKRLILENFEHITRSGPLFAFNDECKRFYTLAQVQDQLYADSVTSFAKALADVCAYAESNRENLRFADVLFFTDGCENAGFSVFKYQCKLSGNYVEKVWLPMLTSLEARFHVIGYSKEHDLEAMKKLVGPAELGHTYQYCPDPGTLSEVFLNVLQYNKKAAETVLCLHLFRDKVPLAQPGLHSDFSVSFPFDKEELLDTATPTRTDGVTPAQDAFVPSDWSCVSARVALNNHLENRQVVGADAVGLETVVEETPYSIQDELAYVQWLLEKPATSVDDANTVGECLDKLMKTLKTLRTDSEDAGAGKKPVSTAERKSVVSRVFELRLELSRVYSQLAKAAPTDSCRSNGSQTGSGFEAEAYRFAAARALPKSNRYKRVLQKAIAELEDSVAAEAERLVRKALDCGEVFPWSAESGALPGGLAANDLVCELCLSNCDELAQTGDCLCVALCVDRKESSVASPGMIAVRSVKQNLYSFSVFRRLVAQMQKSDQLDGNDHTVDFQRLLGTQLLDDRVLKPFNAVFPLFVHPGHWPVAQAFFKLACGWIVALDERVGCGSQIVPVVCCLAYGAYEAAHRSRGARISDKKRVAIELLWQTLKTVFREETAAFDLLSQKLLHTVDACFPPSSPPQSSSPDEKCVSPNKDAPNKDASKLAGVKTNKGAVSNLDTVVGALLLRRVENPFCAVSAFSELSPNEKRVVFAETQRRAFKKLFREPKDAIEGS